MGIAISTGRPGGSSGIAAGATTTMRWDPANKSANITLSNGNRTAVSSSGTCTVFGDTALSGLIYIEVALDGQGPAGGQWLYIGVAGGGTARNDAPGSNKGAWFYLTSTGGSPASFGTPQAANGPSVTATKGIASIANADVLRIAFNSVTGEVWFGVAGTWFRGDPASDLLPSGSSLTGGSYYLYAALLNNATNPQLSIPTTTTYPAPAGYAVG